MLRRAAVTTRSQCAHEMTGPTASALPIMASTSDRASHRAFPTSRGDQLGQFDLAAGDEGGEAVDHLDPFVQAVDPPMAGLRGRERHGSFDVVAGGDRAPPDDRPVRG